jgi:hypothetical protein
MRSPEQIRPASVRGAAHSGDRGAALVITLIVCTVLAMVVVAMMQNTTLDRASSAGIANQYRAQLAAEAGVQSALATLMQTTKTKEEDPTRHGPYATVFARDPAGGVSPYMLLARRDLVGGALRTKRLPIFSSAFPAIDYFDDIAAPLIDRNARTVPDVVNGNTNNRTVSKESDLVRDLNAVIPGRPNGLVGLSRNGARVSLPVNWIYYHDGDGAVAGRYAYWVDDESSKLDLRFAGGDDKGAPIARGPGTNRGEISLGWLEQSGLSEPQADNLRIYKARNLPIDDKSLARFPLNEGGSGIDDDALWNEVAPYLTTASLHDRRAPDGKLKLDLNKLIQAEPDDTERIQREVDAIVAAIKDNLPEFGARASFDASSADREFYVRKIAANIRDFVDEDHTPTMVGRDGTVLSFPGVAPGDFIPLGTDLVVEDIPAMGKERGPYLSEYLRIVRVISEVPVAGVANLFDLQVVFAHYVELHNPTGATMKAADLPGAYVLLANREQWENGTPPPNDMPATLRPSDIVMRLPADFEIPANGYAVLTTDDAVIPEVTGSVYQLTRGAGPGQWDAVDPDLNGTDLPLAGEPERYQIRATTGTATGADRATRFNFYTRLDSAVPYKDSFERLIFGADAGIIDAAPKIYSSRRHLLGRGSDNPFYRWTFPADPFTSSRNTSNDNNTSPRFSRGDLRANMEISRLENFADGTWRVGGSTPTGFFANAFPAAASTFLTLGSRNYRYGDQEIAAGVDAWRRGWKEYTSDSAGNHFVANRLLRSIGELGFIYDPARHLLAGFRAHGATLRMGQSDAGTNNRAANNTGIEFRNWLGGRGSDTPLQPEYMRNAFLLTDVFAVNETDQGRINPNSLVRDDGMVFRALLDGFTFESNAQENASSALAGRTINAATFLPAMVQNALAGGGLMTVGDISTASLFHAGTNLVAGVNMASAAVSDAGREEFFRRTADLLTTHSLAFTIYSVGQSGRFVGNEFQPTSTAIKEVIAQLAPEYPEPADDFERVAPSGWRSLRVRQMSH